MQVSNFKKSREKLNITQIHLARILNVDNSTVSGWETGKDTIPLEKLVDYANKYKYSLNYLFGISKINKFDNQYVINIEKIGRKLKKLRKDNKLTIEEVSKKLNTSKSTFWAYENGKTLINTSFLFGLTKIFENFSIDDLFLEKNK